jgi:RNA polymerase sigma-70 factor (ECF subfamily)
MDPVEHDQDVERLVERAQAGDREAVGGIYDLLADRIYRFALFRVGNPADAEDLMQRTFLKMIESLPRYRQRGVPFEAWFFRLARNAVIDHLRGRRSHQSLDAATEVAHPAPDPAESAELALEFRRLEAGLRELSPLQQEVIGYRFMAGLSAREIGQVLGKREGSIRAIQFRALEYLRRQRGHEGLDAGARDPHPRPESELES